MKISTLRTVVVRSAIALFCAPLLASAALAQQECDAGESPDVIVGDLHQLQRYGSQAGITSYSVGTVSCNIGTCWLNWISETNQHPVIGQNMFRFKDGRFEQIGQSWLKHGFFALSQDFCSTECQNTDGDHLGVNCSDPYSSSLNGSQNRLGPKSEVNPTTGDFLYPFTTQGQTGDVLYKRLQVHDVDLDPALNPGARYYVEGQYITSDDSSAGNADNNASYREVQVVDSGGGVFDLSFLGSTIGERPAILAWPAAESGVDFTFHSVPDDGLFVVAAKVSDLGNGRFHYEYAVQNLTSNRAAMSFKVPIIPSYDVTGVGFHDVDYHSGEPYDGTDWPGVVNDEANPGSVFWSTDSFAVNPDANALRWGTLYNFRFEADAAPATGSITLGLFRPGDPASVQISTLAPGVCNGNGECEPGEDCNNCPNDCPGQAAQTPVCGDGICQPSSGEDCVSCPSDCNGDQAGNPHDDFCCGDGDGDVPVDCSDPRCSEPGFTCGVVVDPFCCGDGFCDPGEDTCICANDCGAPPPVESVCDDGVDEDCDGGADCTDIDCCADALCDDGVDSDGDGETSCDCDDGNNAVWLTPTEVPDLDLPSDGPGGSLLEWTLPVEPGAATWTYDVLRSSNGDEFTAAICLDQVDPSTPTAIDVEIPLDGDVYYYLVRGRNDCPGASGEGSLGATSIGDNRAGAGCP